MAQGEDEPGGGIDVVARKLEADELGREAQVPLHDIVDVAVLDQHDQPLLLEKRAISREQTTFTMIVVKMPARAGIDPCNKLIDRRPKDNTVTSTE